MRRWVIYTIESYTHPAELDELYTVTNDNTYCNIIPELPYFLPI